MTVFTADDLRSFAPNMKAFYREVLLSKEGEDCLRAAGILDNGKRCAHFLGQCGAETGGFTILRESLTYTNVQRIREVWPARSSKFSDAELQ